MLLHDKSSFLIFFSSKMYCMCVFFGSWPCCTVMYAYQGGVILHVFWIFKFCTLLSIRFIFRSSLPNNFFRVHVAFVQRSFHIQTITGALKINISFYLQLTSFYFKNNRQKKNWNSVQFNIFLGPHNGAMVKGKHIYFCFCF